MTELEELLHERIARTGPLPFGAFMQLALYHPRLGYYSGPRERSGWRGHFLTSAELDPSYGALWARAFEKVWGACGRPEEFAVVEVGPGEGGFAEAVLSSVSGEFARCLRYRLVERAAAARGRQEERLRDRSASWSPAIAEVPRVACGVVFANEVLDNLPVHLVRRDEHALREICVGLDGNRLILVDRDPSTPELARFLQRCDIELAVGHRFEVTLAAESLVARVAAMFDTGAAIFVDYGAEASALAERPAGSLLAYSERGTDDRVLEDPGTKDITAHANWTAVRNACAAAGITVAPVVSQRRALEALGLHRLHDELRATYDRAVEDGRGADGIAALSRRQALGALADPGGLGGLQVLVAARGIDPSVVVA